MAAVRHEGSEVNPTFDRSRRGCLQGTLFTVACAVVLLGLLVHAAL